MTQNSHNMYNNSHSDALRLIYNEWGVVATIVISSIWNFKRIMMYYFLQYEIFFGGDNSQVLNFFLRSQNRLEIDEM